ncbi:MAG: hypothetical protein ABJC63_16355 [Gemmatimonadales bacterium]
MRMLELGRRRDLELESLDTQVASFAWQHLDNDLPIEGELRGNEDARHAAAELALNRVCVTELRPQIVPQLVSHVFSSPCGIISGCLAFFLVRSQL